MQIEYDLEFRNFGTKTKVSLKSGTMFPVNSSKFRMFGFHFHHRLMMLDLKHRVVICLGFDWLYQRLQGQIFFITKFLTQITQKDVCPRGL